MLPADVPLQVLAVGTELSDPTGQLTARYGLSRDGAVLVRPDGYVAWCASMAEDDVAETLGRVIATSLGRSQEPADRLASVA